VPLEICPAGEVPGRNEGNGSPQKHPGWMKLAREIRLAVLVVINRYSEIRLAVLIVINRYSEIRLAVPKGPNHTSLLNSLARCGMRVKDMSFRGLLADDESLEEILGTMVKDLQAARGQAAAAPVYILDVRSASRDVELRVGYWVLDVVGLGLRVGGLGVRG